MTGVAIGSMFGGHSRGFGSIMAAETTGMGGFNIAHAGFSCDSRDEPKAFVLCHPMEHGDFLVDAPIEKLRRIGFVGGLG